MRTSSEILAVAAASLAVLVAVRVATAAPADPPSPTAAAVLNEMRQTVSLKPASAFGGIADPKARSAALFREMGKVITHPRCANCHPAEHPAQGNDRHLHMPLVSRGPDGHGEGLPCASCHTAANVWVGGTRIVTIPGHPKWGLAPASMAWQGKTLAEICAQLKDPTRNGGRTLAQIQDHMAHDDLVGWGWNPGAGRTPAPGTQAQLGELTQAWIDTGAVCPATGGTRVPTHDPAAKTAAVRLTPVG
jgi:hypothetical protein